jgi:hypothetical protein
MGAFRPAQLKRINVDTTVQTKAGITSDRSLSLRWMTIPFTRGLKLDAVYGIEKSEETKNRTPGGGGAFFWKLLPRPRFSLFFPIHTFSLLP